MPDNLVANTTHKHAKTWLDGGCWQDEPPGSPVSDQDGNIGGFDLSQQQHACNEFIACADDLDAAVVLDHSVL
jgi:hypothetical protein